MKTLKLLFTILFATTFLSSCLVTEVVDDRGNIIDETPVSLNELISSYDLWYIDIQNTQGTYEVPFLQRAFTVSFFDGRMYGNNNIVDIGKTGNGFGVEIGTYDTFGTNLETSHRQGISNFRVVQISDNEIRLEDTNQNVSYYLIGYQKTNFDYVKLFYDNIEYLLQEFVAWEKVKQVGGSGTAFDGENYLEFTPDNDKSFRSSKDNTGINIEGILWDYEGGYKISDYTDVDNVKHLTLFYNNNDTEKFDMHVLNYETIMLEHLATGTEYTFKGRGFIQYLRGGIGKNEVTRNSRRARRKIIRNKMIKRN